MRVLSSAVVLIAWVCTPGCTFDRSGVAVHDRDAAGPDRSGPDARRRDGRPLDSRGADAWRDLAPGDLPRADAPPRNLPPLPDAPPLLPDTGGCLVESFASGLGPVQPKTGQWVVGGGVVRQSQTGGGNFAAIAGVTFSDYVVSAYLTVHSTFPKSGWVVGAAVGVRLQPGPALTPRQYLCGVYPGSNALVIVHCSGGDPNTTCQVVRQTGPAVAVGQQVLVRATVVGTSLTCELPGLGGSTTYNTGGLTSGGPTLITQYVDASYDDLSVCPHVP
jgi:hypothetical protein